MKVKYKYEDFKPVDIGTFTEKLTSYLFDYEIDYINIIENYFEGRTFKMFEYFQKLKYNGIEFNLDDTSKSNYIDTWKQLFIFTIEPYKYVFEMFMNTASETLTKIKGFDSVKRIRSGKEDIRKVGHENNIDTINYGKRINSNGMSEDSPIDNDINSIITPRVKSKTVSDNSGTDTTTKRFDIDRIDTHQYDNVTDIETSPEVLDKLFNIYKTYNIENILMSTFKKCTYEFNRIY